MPEMANATALLIDDDRSNRIGLPGATRVMKVTR